MLGSPLASGALSWIWLASDMREASSSSSQKTLLQSHTAKTQYNTWFELKGGKGDLNQIMTIEFSHKGYNCIRLL